MEPSVAGGGQVWSPVWLGEGGQVWSPVWLGEGGSRYEAQCGWGRGAAGMEPSVAGGGRYGAQCVWGGGGGYGPSVAGGGGGRSLEGTTHVYVYFRACFASNSHR